ncbi:MAG: LysE family translocator [Solirubrobacteraceae bacterium]
MLPTPHPAAFLLTVYALIVVPGPSVAFVVSRGVSLGRSAALATVLGNAAGFALQLVVVAVGVGSVLARSEVAFEVLKILGATYLVALGLRSIWQRKTLALTFATTPARKPLAQILREGFVVGATNPKGLVIFAAILPRFLDRGSGSAPADLLMLGAICIALAIVSDGAWALISGTVGDRIGTSSRRLERLSLISGLILIALGITLALSARSI